MASILKEKFPEATIGFLAKPYTHPVLETCGDIDVILDSTALAASVEDVMRWDAIVHVFPDKQIAEWARTSQIPLRIGTTNRLFHWWTCNKLVRLGRRRSDLHEAQLNLKLLAPLGIERAYSLSDLGTMVDLQLRAALPAAAESFLQRTGPKVILHPSSRGSTREWSLENFTKLASILSRNGYAVAITGVAQDRASIQPMLSAVEEHATDLIGELSLSELMCLIKVCEGLVAASTGPLHLAGVLRIPTIGLYPPERPMHAGRWAAIGPFVETLTGATTSKVENRNVIEGISPEDVAGALTRQMDLRRNASR